MSVRWQARAFVLLLAVLGAGALRARAESLDFPASSDFDILDGQGASVVGHGRYDFTSTGPTSYRLHGENHFRNGDYDIEEDRIESGASGELATVTSYRHDYFDHAGALQRTAQADFRAGEGSCVVYEGGRLRPTRAKFEFPRDTYSGSTVLIPLTHHLRRGFHGPIVFHNFNCVPGPRLLSVKAYPPRRAVWKHYPGQLVEVRIKPELGWLGMLIGPFIPKMDAWFEPARDWAYVGGKAGRFYRGPEIILVRSADKAH